MEEKPYHEIADELTQKDPKLGTLIAEVSVIPQPSPETDIYCYLLESIVSQQISVKVADVIWDRFLALFPDRYPHASTLLELTDETLRSAGLSRQKAGYMKNVAVFEQEKGMAVENLIELSDQEIITYLTEIKGVGKWTVQMVLMFPLDRPDVFPIDDLGIQTKLIEHYQLSGTKKELRAQMNKVAENWRPYRSLACKYLWRS